MKEDFLHYLWKYKLLSEPLSLTTGQEIEIIEPGTHNQDSGPDFFNAKIKIADTIWAGNVELHVKSSDWIKHNHHKDLAYNNIILHVVATNDKVIANNEGKPFPTAEIKVPKDLYEHYLFLMQNSDWVPCESFVSKVDDFTILQWKEALLVERLTEKAKLIDARFKQTNSNWEETFYQSLAHNFGFKTNSQPFEMLAQSIPLIVLGKHKDDLSLIEALLFGQSGMLPAESDDVYVKQLIKDYKHLATKFSLSPLSGHLWKFMRLRPANFPTIRLAQFATLIHQSSNLFSKVLEIKDIAQLEKLFAVQASSFWDKHYSFENESDKRTKKLGKVAFHNILINTIAPLLFYYAQQKSKPEYVDRILEWLILAPGENNSITNKWKAIGIESKNAFDSQALIQLKNVYCKYRRCLQCRIGNKVVKHTF